MNIVLSNTSEAPIYRQIFEQVGSQIIKREIPGGACLPPIRTVAKELHVSVITVKKAWEELERAGYIDTIAGKGCFVASLPPSALDDKKFKLILDRLTKDIQYCESLGFTAADVLELLRKRYGL